MKLASKILSLLTAVSAAQPTIAQEWYRINVHDESNNKSNYEWSFPYAVSQFSHFDFSSDRTELRGHRVDEEDGTVTYVPFSVAAVDSIMIVNELPESEQTHNKYQVYTLNVTTNGSVGVNSKEDYVNCFVSLDGKDGYNCYSGTGRIRGRGNSTWAWYDKKPYRLKLDKKNKMLGLDKSKDWVLLANYRDVTDLMNTFMFETASWMGMSYVNHTRYVELFLDGDYKGLYQMTEQVEQGKNRVNVADNGGILLAMDYDDGPDGDTSTDASFFSSVFSMPMCVKYPKDATAAQVDSIKNLLGTLETAIKDADYDALDKVMDMKSFMTMAMLQEYSQNVEICAPRSIYMYKDVNGKWFMGPFWDWDAGFDFDWSDMMTGHTYFSDYTELVLGTDPAKRKGMCGSTPRFFTDMFKSATYTQAYKDLWNSVKDSIFTRNWAEMEKYIAELDKGAYSRDIARWPLTSTYSYGFGKHEFSVSEEIAKMKTWLQNRTSYLDEVINAYPDPSKKVEETDCGMMTINVKLSQQKGYSQDGVIEIEEDSLAKHFGLSLDELYEVSVSLTSLNSDGSDGWSSAQGTWGAWFDTNGDVCDYTGKSHVFIEPSDLWTNDIYSWNYGCHPDNCKSGDKHTVYMKFTAPLKDGNVGALKVRVNFGIDVNP